MVGVAFDGCIYGFCNGKIKILWFKIKFLYDFKVLTVLYPGVN